MLAEQAVRHGSDDAAVLAQAANAIIDLEHDVVRARALASRATIVNPGCARAWFISGLVHFLNGAPDEAIADLQTASRLDPISPLNDIIQVHIGAALLMQGDYPEGLRLMRATTHRTARIHLALAAGYGNLNMPAESLKELGLFHERSRMSVEEVIAAATVPDRFKSAVLEGINRARETQESAAD
jgi:tetratricopeptide (TPR) repeat protein